MRKLPSPKYLDECFRYDEKTGRLFWRERPAKHFYSAKFAAYWNRRWAGKIAFHISQRGYCYGQLDHRYCAAHRVIWKIKTRREPPAIIDHADQNKSNNRWMNLRAATKAQNCINRKIHPRSTTGYGGVHKHKNKNRWVAQLGTRTKKRYLGIFDSPQKARSAWLIAAKKEYGEFLPCP